MDIKTIQDKKHTEKTENSWKKFNNWFDKSKITERIMLLISDWKNTSSSEYESILRKLKELEFSDLKSLMLFLINNKVNSSNIADLVMGHKNDRFTKYSQLSQREILKFDWLIYDSIPYEYIDIELSTVNPIWLNFLLWNINQDTLLSTVRWNEVIWDATTVLSLIASQKRKEEISKWNTKTTIKLCTSHRLTRWQNYNKSWFNPHFRTFNICFAWQTDGRLKFEISSFYEILDLYLNILNTFASKWFLNEWIIVEISDLRIANSILLYHWIKKDSLTDDMRNSKWFFEKLGISIESKFTTFPEYIYNELNKYWIDNFLNTLWVFYNEIIIRLKEKYPNITFLFNLDRIRGMGYYHWICFEISGINKNWERITFIDWWYTDWTQKLMNNKKERFLSTGFWSEYYYSYFKK